MTTQAPKGPTSGIGPWANVLAKFPARLVIEHEKEHDTAVYSIQWYSAPSVEALYRYLDGASDENVRMVANISLPMERLEKFARPYKARRANSTETKVSTIEFSEFNVLVSSPHHRKEAQPSRA